MTRYRSLLAALAVLAALTIVAGTVDARPGSGGSSGSRGVRTNAPPAPTATAPKNAAPMERTMTPATKTAPQAAPAPAGARPGFFGRTGFVGGLFAGFLGAGLIGLLFGHGLFGGLGGLASILGLILQIGLVVIVGRLIWMWWQRRQAPATATAGGPQLRDVNAYARESTEAPYGGAYGAGGGTGSGGDGTSPITIGPSDYDTFERLLGEVTVAYAASDLSRLRALATPEMLSYFSDDLARYASRGLVNEVGDIKLEQGDLSEAWREGNDEYATVAMRYRLRDAWIERASDRVVEGSREPHEVTELWTFRRATGGDWMLSAIQQAS